MESESAGFTGVVGFMIHGLNGQFLVPLIALLLLLVSFFAKVPRGVLWAGLLFLLVIVQVCWEYSAAASRRWACCMASTLSPCSRWLWSQHARRVAARALPIGPARRPGFNEIWRM